MTIQQRLVHLDDAQRQPQPRRTCWQKSRSRQGSSSRAAFTYLMPGELRCVCAGIGLAAASPKSGAALSRPSLCLHRCVLQQCNQSITHTLQWLCCPAITNTSCRFAHLQCALLLQGGPAGRGGVLCTRPWRCRRRRPRRPRLCGFGPGADFFFHFLFHHIDSLRQLSTKISNAMLMKKFVLVCVTAV